jgi:uncharacterized protein YukE
VAIGYGADVAQLRSLSDQLARSAEQLDQIRSALTAQITTSTAWVGPDAERFRGEWTGQHRAVMDRCAAALREGATSLRRNAQEQETASAVDGGVGAGGEAVLRAALEAVDAPGTASFEEQLRMFHEAFDDAKGFTLPMGVNGWDLAWGALGHVESLPGFIGGIGTVIDAVDYFADVIEGNLTVAEAVHGGVDIVADGLKMFPPTYLPGVAISAVNMAIEEAAEVDWSWDAFTSTVDYVANNPVDALAGAAEGLVSHAGKFLNIF